MAFKKTTSAPLGPETPDQLLRLLSRRTIPDVLPHQRYIMQTYAASALSDPDVALQLPTGSGKTLVGLLIAEWKRRTRSEKVVYLCPTSQLVNQVAEEANTKYGMSVIPFTGPIKGYAPADRAAYNLAQNVAITNYSSLFNTNPFFADPDTIIIDDAHTAEAYVANMWSMNIDRYALESATLFGLVAQVLSRYVSPETRRRISEAPEDDDYVWVDKLTTPDFYSVADELTELFDVHIVPKTDLWYKWKLIRDHLSACHLYISGGSLLIRPLVPPTWTVPAFENATQRLYMSATLGAGGDMERLMGRRYIRRLPIEKDWDRQGVGRRFFIFPGLSLDGDQTVELKMNLMRAAGRSLVLVRSDATERIAVQEVSGRLGYPTFTASDLEISKQAFTQTPQAVAVIANRYDGMNFPGDDCRLLMVDGLPKAMNLQERFLMSRMGASLLFNERVQTRVLQAIGRCTRSLQDYSAVVISGHDLSEYLINTKRRRFLHPELQAELQFGIDQSSKTDLRNMSENFILFLNDRKQWEDAEQQIVAYRQDALREPFPSMDELSNAVGDEVRYEEEIWKGHFENATTAAETVIGKLTGEGLRGYRALWHYLAGSAAWLSVESGGPLKLLHARTHYVAATKAAAAVPWLRHLSTLGDESSVDELKDKNTVTQIENVEAELEKLGTLHDATFSRMEKLILDGITGTESSAFEESQRQLGVLLGFNSYNSNGTAAPDPWWYVNQVGLVFESHSDGNPTSTLGATKARQVESHPRWLKANDVRSAGVVFQPVLVTPVRTVERNSSAFLEGVHLWDLDAFRAWSRNALGIVRTLRSGFQAGDPEWRQRAYDIFIRENLGIDGLLRFLAGFPAKTMLTPN